MAQLLEALGGRRADALSRRVGTGQLGVSFLECPQLVEEAIVLGVRELGIVEHVVAIVVVLDQRP